MQVRACDVPCVAVLTFAAVLNDSKAPSSESHLCVRASLSKHLLFITIRMLASLQCITTALSRLACPWCVNMSDKNEREWGMLCAGRWTEAQECCASNQQNLLGLPL